jgi:hypothetical protein
MKKIIIIASLFVTILFIGCKKDLSATSNTSSPGGSPAISGTTLNTWTFKEGSVVHTGVFDSLILTANLNTYLQGSNTYTFGLLGEENANGNFLNIVLSMDDTTFTRKNYESGDSISTMGRIDAFYYFQTLGGTNTFESSNYYNDIGATMNYTIDSYNPSTTVLVMSFSGQAKDSLGNNVNITAGKLTCPVEKY